MSHRNFFFCIRFLKMCLFLITFCLAKFPSMWFCFYSRTCDIIEFNNMCDIHITRISDKHWNQTCVDIINVVSCYPQYISIRAQCVAYHGYLEEHGVRKCTHYDRHQDHSIHVAKSVIWRSRMLKSHRKAISNLNRNLFHFPYCLLL